MHLPSESGESSACRCRGPRLPDHRGRAWGEPKGFSGEGKALPCCLLLHVLSDPVDRDLPLSCCRDICVSKVHGAGFQLTTTWSLRGSRHHSGLTRRWSLVRPISGLEQDGAPGHIGPIISRQNMDGAQSPAPPQLRALPLAPAAGTGANMPYGSLLS